MSGEQAAQPAGETSMAETSTVERANRRAEQTPAEQAIAADIERTRAELAETVHELTSKVDVVARARHAAVGMRRYWAGLAGAAAGLALTAVFIRKLRRR
jgi:hypothetical protein